MGMTALLVGMQDNPAVPDGWDMVLNLSESAVQALVQSNWKGASPAADESHSLRWVAPTHVDGHHDVVQVKTNLPLPVVSLSLDDQAVHVAFPIDSGTLQTGKAPAQLVSLLGDTASVHESDEVCWSAPVAITDQNPLHLAGALPVAVEAAEDGRRFSIGLKPDGNLTLSSHDEGGLSSHDVNQNLTSWLATRDVSDQIGTLALQDGADAHVLTPAAVAARVVVAHDGKPLLQIMTSASPTATAPASSDPVPHFDDNDFSLMVSSKATMAMIASSYNQGTGDIKLASLPPEDGQTHWFAEVHEPMVFEGSFGRQDGETYVTDRSQLHMRFGGSPDQGLKLFTYIDPSSTIQLQLDLAAHYPVGFTGAGDDRIPGLGEGAQSVAANGFYEAIVQPQLEKFLTGQIKSDMTRVQMPEVSQLVLRDLTLSGHDLGFEVAELPGELLIAGSLIPAT